MSIKTAEFEQGMAWQSAADGWWSAEQDPPTAGLYVVYDKQRNYEVATWLCDWNGKNGQWTRELTDVDRDNIVAWMRVPDPLP